MPPRKKSTESKDFNPTNIVPQELLDQALALEIKVEPPKSQQLNAEQLNDVIQRTADQYKTDPSTAFVGICATLQAGGTNKNKRSNVKIKIKEIPFESKVVNEIIQKQTTFTPRQFARQIANEIYKISEKHQITGNAYVSLRRFYAEMLTEITDTERYWAADFQIDNPNCPQYIREALRKRYTDKFANRKKLK